MNTIDLIHAALQAKETFDRATTDAQAAAQALRDAALALQQANQTLHDDLDANGPCVVIDDTASPPTVLLYTAADPDSYAVTEIRVAA